MGVLAVIAGVNAVSNAVQSVINTLNLLDAARTVVLEIDNNTNVMLTLVADEHEHGGWGEPPVSEIPAGMALVFGSRDRGFMTGTKGNVTYSGDGFTITASWDNPFLGSNSCELRLEGPNSYRYWIHNECGAGNTNAKMRYELFAANVDVARYGAVVKLQHAATSLLLHSHPLHYGHPGGSGQQQVTCFGGYDDNDNWRLKGPDGVAGEFRAGERVQHGDVIRLEHVRTGRNLHSHGGFRSPVTGQQEVTCFGDAGVGDGNDNWRVEVEGGGAVELGVPMRLVHEATGAALHSHDGFSHPDWTRGQQEVTGFLDRDGNDFWRMHQRL